MIEHLLKSVIDSDEAAVVICDLDHTVIYMNPAAVKRYAKRGGAALIGSSLLDCHNADSNEKINRVLEWFRKSVEEDIPYVSAHKAELVDKYTEIFTDLQSK